MAHYVETIVRVRYAETDQMRVAHHANYLKWFDVGRAEFCRHFGVEYAKMEVEGDTFTIVVKSSCCYKRPARFDDVLRIRTQATGWQRRTVSFGYEIRNQADQLIATGETFHVFCDRFGRPKSLPEKYHKYFSHLHADIKRGSPATDEIVTSASKIGT
jgi:acyl-CoA thioester hydrolase